MNTKREYWPSLCRLIANAAFGAIVTLLFARMIWEFSAIFWVGVVGFSAAVTIIGIMAADFILTVLLDK